MRWSSCAPARESMCRNKRSHRPQLRPDAAKINKESRNKQKDPVCKFSRILRCWGLEFSHRSLGGGHNSAYNIHRQINKGGTWELLNYRSPDLQRTFIFEEPKAHRNSGNSGWLFFLGSKITADGDCSHEIKTCLLLGRKVMISLDSVLKSRDITLLTKVHIVKAMAFQ